MTLLLLEDVSRSFWRGRHEIRALQSVSLEIAAGEMVAVYGKASAGKTTLLRTAAGLLAPTAGRVLLDGQDLTRCSRGELARLHREDIGWVERGGPKSNELPIRVYVALALYRQHGAKESQRRATAALDRVGVGHGASAYWGDLSDTDRVLVAIAQALVHGPRLLVVDDPTYGFAMSDRERVVGLLRSVSEEAGIAVLMAVPDMPSMLSAHQVRLINRGRLIEPAELRSDGRANVIRFPSDERSR
jgi:ABC-type lipoprotein export system ATPase subunit